MKKSIEEIKTEVVAWTKDWFEKSGGKGIIIGISGGKDSLVAAKICCEAIGARRVFGVLMPNGDQKDINDALLCIKALGISCTIHNIQKTYNAFIKDAMLSTDDEVRDNAAKFNVPPRIRMAVLYYYAQILGYRVCGTGNLSETYLGYSTKWGDSGCDFNPLGGLTKSTVVDLGDAFELPYDLVHKAPADGLTGKTDEEVLGVSYRDTDRYIESVMEGSECSISETALERIFNKKKYGMHKHEPVPVYNPYDESLEKLYKSSNSEENH